MGGAPSGAGAYHVGKFALESAMIALAQEVAAFGVYVRLVELGDTHAR